MKKILVLFVLVALCSVGCKQMVEESVEDVKYTITFHAGGGQGTMKIQEFIPGKETKLNKLEFSNPKYEEELTNYEKYLAEYNENGYYTDAETNFRNQAKPKEPKPSDYFTCWINFTEDGKIELYNDESLVTLNKSVTLYAWWVVKDDDFLGTTKPRYFYTSA